jgi:amidase
MMDDGLCRPTPPVTRALEETRAALEAAGHKVIEFTPYDAPGGVKLLLRCLTGDGGLKIHSMVRGGQYPEPWPKDLDMFEDRYEASKGNPPSIGDLWALQAERNAYLSKLLKSWAATAAETGTGRPIDGLLCPAVATPASPTYKFKYFGYTSLWNLADHTGSVFPAGFVNKNDVASGDIQFRSDEEKFVWDNCEYYMATFHVVFWLLLIPPRQRRGDGRYAHRSADRYPPPQRGA